jgi:hypothetical protein
MLNNLLRTCLTALCCTLASCTMQRYEPHNYYFDPLAGNDLNDGTSPDKAFRSLVKAMEISPGPGDSILLKSGCIFTDTLFISCMGAPGKPVVVGKYGGRL